MATIDQIICSTYTGNTGWGKCPYIPAPRRFAILVPSGTRITEANLANPLSYIQGKLIDNSDVLRWHSFGAFKGFDKDGEDVQKFTFQDRSSIITADPTQGMVYMLFNGGLCTQKNLQDFDGAHTAYEVFYADSKGRLQFERTANPTTGAVELKGFAMDEFYVYPMDEPTYSDPAMTKLRILHGNPKEMYRNMAIIDLSPDLYDVTHSNFAVQNAVLTNVTPGGAAAGVFHVRIMGGCSDNLATLYGASMANVARFAATNDATGAAITITSAALNTAGDAVILTLNTADPDYPIPPALLDITLVSISTLAAAGIKYYDGNVLTVAAT